ncbi:Uncharacterised protein [Streptococcus pneumoniae]|nr:Uncharacterised protein [Streptococcus pneumoniae]VMY44540.1 Uncharacterised protein [Streptococcus pneumoniae]
MSENYQVGMFVSKYISMYLDKMSAIFIYEIDYDIVKVLVQ